LRVRRYRSPGTRKGRPRVDIVVIRDNDGSTLTLSEAKALDEPLGGLRLREIRFLANGVLLWATDVERAGDAHQRLCGEISQQARERNVTSFDAMVSALQSTLHWTTDEARALAIMFTFPSHLALERARVAWAAPPTRGRPVRVDGRTKHVWMLARAWQTLTGTAPGVSSNALFVVAVSAAAPFLGASGIGAVAIRNVDRLLRRERNKLRSPHVRWVPPTEHR
jgi:hypothetical protein